MCLSACTWEDFKNKAKDVWDNLVAIDDNGNDMLNGETYEMPSAMTFRSSAPNTSKSVTLTVSFSPSTAKTPDIVWSVAWDTSSTNTWKDGKNIDDYLTVSPNSTSSLKAGVQFKEDFGCPIVITASVRLNPEIKSSCTCNCYQNYEITGFRYIGDDISTLMGSDFVLCFNENSSLDLNGEEFTQTFFRNAFEVSTAGHFDFDVNSSSVYTRAVTSPTMKIYVKASDAFYNAVIANSDIMSHYPDIRNNWGGYAEVKRTAFNTPSDYEMNYSISLTDLVFTMFKGLIDSTTYAADFYDLKNVMRSVSGNHFMFKIEFSSTAYDGSTEFGMRFSDNAMGAVATSLSMSKSFLNF